jgi:hypothetical protein
MITGDRGYRSASQHGFAVTAELVPAIQVIVSIEF